MFLSPVMPNGAEPVICPRSVPKGQDPLICLLLRDSGSARRLIDEQMARLRPFFPKGRARERKPRVDDRYVALVA